MRMSKCGTSLLDFNLTNDSVFEYKNCILSCTTSMHPMHDSVDQALSLKFSTVGVTVGGCVMRRIDLWSGKQATMGAHAAKLADMHTVIGVV